MIYREADHWTVSAAREYLAAGFSLKQVAGMLGVLSQDLDQGLWRWFGIEIEKAPRRYAPDFEDDHSSASSPQQQAALLLDGLSEQLEIQTRLGGVGSTPGH